MSTSPTASISKITFSGGDTFKFKPNEKIILVGPNNSGKSQTLREIVQTAVQKRGFRPTVLKTLEVEKIGTTQELKTFLEENAEITNGNYHYKGWNIPVGHEKLWSEPYLQHGLSAGYIKNIDANDRLKICEQQPSIGPNQHKSKPQHVLYDDAGLMEKISGLFKQAFGKDIMFDFRGGSVLPIHVGEKPNPSLIDRVSDTYVKEVRKNPLLSEQGDGMKSYAGILFEAIVADLAITLLDEPEAFLHPPQMRRLGFTLAAEVSGQLIVATHSSDIMRGFLEGTKGDVRILRIRRDGEINRVAEAPGDVIKELWTRPELRYSNALEGVFHEQTIICEDDSDCRLFNAVADNLAAADQEQWLDTAYVPTGGKHGIPKVATVLRRIGVPIKAIFDLDFLSECQLVKETVDAFGGDWETFEPFWSRLDAAVRKGVKPKTSSEIKREVTSIILESAPDELPRSKIKEALKQGAAWNRVKELGSVAIPKGDAQRNFSALRGRLEAIGIYIVHVGEIENFCMELGNHGPKFVNRLLTEVPLEDKRLSDLRQFVARVHKGPASPVETNLRAAETPSDRPPSP